MSLQPHRAADVRVDAGVQQGQRRLGLEDVHALMRRVMRMACALAQPVAVVGILRGGLFGARVLLVRIAHGQRCQQQQGPDATRPVKPSVAQAFAQILERDQQDHASALMWSRYRACRSVAAICRLSRLSTSRPRFMMPTRVAVCRAWNRSCVVARMATPDSLARCSSRVNSAAADGSNPEVGSSSSRARAFLASATAIQTFWRMPLEYAATRLSAAAASSPTSSSSAIRRSRGSTCPNASAAK
ncbi:hypothetical protein G6F22_016845 [Rhizopus arrhizus]|nr:hypothetical protein G6F22_016845 [Rhizopus arrhizus]